ncbi:hypothetical protein C7S15_6572 [Burkholderia cepacia]|nr:hypothetical protein [Burkholderia cepacia]
MRASIHSRHVLRLAVRRCEPDIPNATPRAIRHPLRTRAPMLRGVTDVTDPINRGPPARARALRDNAPQRFGRARAPSGAVSHSVRARIEPFR